MYLGCVDGLVSLAAHRTDSIDSAYHGHDWSRREALLIPVRQVEYFAGFSGHCAHFFEVDRATAESEVAGLEVLSFWASAGAQSSESAILVAVTGLGPCSAALAAF